MTGMFKAAYVFIVAMVSLRYLGPEAPVLIEPLNPGDPESLPDGVTRNVLVVGGGLAGLSASLELAERGYHVTIKEASPTIGGRLTSTEVDLLGETFRVDHGFHAWFYNYYTFKDIRRRLGINDNFKRWRANHFRFRNYKPEVVESKGPYPFNVIATLLKSPNFKIGDIFDIIRISTTFGVYNHDTVYRNYGNMTFDDWVETYRVPGWFADTVLRPALSVTFNERTVLNAAEMIMYSHFYFTGDNKADNREIATVDHRSAVFDPWIERLGLLGTSIQMNTPVRRLIFNANGRVVGDSSEPEVVYDHMVLAADLQAVKSIFSETIRESPNNPQVACLQNRLSQLPMAPPYKVIRLWLDQQLDSDRPAILQTPDFYPINLVVQYHLIEAKSREWSQRTGGSVVEFHLYAWTYDNVKDCDIWAIISPVAKEIYPEISERSIKILAYFVHSGNNFASFPKKLEHLRPTSSFPRECGVKNLNLAGDWLHTPYPSALMERAVSTGRLAANQILLSDHVKQAPMLVMSNYGPGYI